MQFVFYFCHSIVNADILQQRYKSNLLCQNFFVGFVSPQKNS